MSSIVRKPLRRILAIVLLVLLAAVAGIWFSIRALAAAKWARLEARAAELRKGKAGDEPERPVFRRDPLPGNAWEDYAAALQAPFEQGSYPDLWIPFAAMPQRRVFPERTRSVLNRHRGAILRLQSGARKIPGRRPAGLRPSVYDVALGVVPVQVLGSLVLWESARLSEAGRADEAAEMLVDLMVFAEDLARGGTSTDHFLAEQLWNPALDEMRALLETHRLSAEELSLLAGTLPELERHLPSCAALLRRMVLSLEESFVQDGERTVYVEGIGMYRPSGSGQREWRYGYSGRLAAATAVLWVDSWVDRFFDVDRLSWSDVGKLQEQFTRDAASFRNDTGRTLAPSFNPEQDHVRRGILARIRLLSMLVSILRTGTCPEMADPFGTTMRKEVTPKGLKLWSVGWDGVDHGGKGVWGRALRSDIVLEVQR